MAIRIMQSSDKILDQSVVLENSTLQVTPLKIQPPTHIVFSYLKDGNRRLEWLKHIPWRIEVGSLLECHAKIEVESQDLTHSYEVYTDVDVTASTYENPFFNRDEISIRGVILDSDNHEPRAIRVAPKSTVKAYLYVGADVIVQNPYCCGIRTSKDRINPITSFEGYKQTTRKVEREEKREASSEAHADPLRIVFYGVGL